MSWPGRSLPPPQSVLHPAAVRQRQRSGNRPDGGAVEVVPMVVACPVPWVRPRGHAHTGVAADTSRTRSHTAPAGAPAHRRDLHGSSGRNPAESSGRTGADRGTPPKADRCRSPKRHRQRESAGVPLPQASGLHQHVHHGLLRSLPLLASNSGSSPVTSHRTSDIERRPEVGGQRSEVGVTGGWSCSDAPAFPTRHRLAGRFRSTRPPKETSHRSPPLDPTLTGPGRLRQ
jgi:hypothetical protein